MTTSLFTFVDLYRRQLAIARHLLDKGAAHAAAQGIAESGLLGWRLAEDMHPLAFQLRVAINFARQWTARVAGLPVPADVATDLDLAGYRAALDEAEADLAALTREQFADRDDAPLAFRIMEGLEPTLPAGRWLTGFATTNIYFHVSMAYAILRMHGVPLGKADLFPGGL